MRPVKTFDSLFAELLDRAATRPDGSGTVAALDAGVHAQGKKLIEEAGEVWLAAEHEGDDALALEISQLHLPGAGHHGRSRHHSGAGLPTSVAVEQIPVDRRPDTDPADPPSS